MPSDEDPYAVPSSEPDMEQENSRNVGEPTDDGVIYAPTKHDGTEDNKPVEIIDYILDPDHHLVDF
ncbi:hypothetical protein FNYG_06096 [Fusarium nygamai]|uniref:Uncharacterized protein n=1 Tax=Gibberella nygamai TaxID=42673 RepID=A0A2K0WDZ4_GIBNY|nr:hypothetical protein FNYG_06096 [Fusarium nygamai]